MRQAAQALDKSNFFPYSGHPDQLGMYLTTEGQPVNNTPYKATGRETGGTYSLLLVNTAPGGGPPLHSHAYEDEGFYVLKGIYRFWIGDAAPVDAHAGTHVFGPRGIFHRFQNIGDSAGELLIIFTPAGCENYFKELAAERERGGHNLLEREEVIDRRYGITINRRS